MTMDEAGPTLDDLDFAETHDCFTIAELIEYEAMGLAEPGQGHRVIREGQRRWPASCRSTLPVG
jgi:acetyl-CoA C-acetyltransferase